MTEQSDKEQAQDWADPAELLRAAVGLAGEQKVWAKQHGVSAQYVNDVLHGRRKPGKTMLNALGLRRVVTYERLIALAKMEKPHAAD